MKRLRIVAGSAFGAMFTFGVLAIVLRPVTATIDRCDQETGDRQACYEHLAAVSEAYYSNPSYITAVGMDMIALAIPTIIFGYCAKKLLQK